MLGPYDVCSKLLSFSLHFVHGNLKTIFAAKTLSGSGPEDHELALALCRSVIKMHGNSGSSRIWTETNTVVKHKNEKDIVKVKSFQHRQDWLQCFSEVSKIYLEGPRRVMELTRKHLSSIEGETAEQWNQSWLQLLRRMQWEEPIDSEMEKKYRDSMPESKPFVPPAAKQLTRPTFERNNITGSLILRNALTHLNVLTSLLLS